MLNTRYFLRAFFSLPRLFPPIALARGENHDHLPPFKTRLQLYLCQGAGFFLDFHQKLHTKLLMRHLASAKAERYFDLVAFIEELLNRTHFDIVVMRIDIGTELDFLDLNGLLLFARLRSLLLSLELVFPEIHDLADGDFPINRNLHEIETNLLSSGKRVALICCAVIFARLVDELNIACDNGFVNARPLLGGRACDGTAYLTSPVLVNEKHAAPASPGRASKMRIKTRIDKSSGMLQHTRLCPPRRLLKKDVAHGSTSSP
jgi:hypothetical protein